MIVCDDVLHWAETYEGAPFHALLTDPPYGLGFMGASWDDFGRTKPYEARTEEGYGHKGILKGYGRGGTEVDRRKFHAKSMQEYEVFMCEAFTALTRHLLPGAFVMAFASSRGYHRLAVAMEDAGLILHPSIFNYRTGEVIDVPSLLGYSFGSGFPKATRIDVAIDKAAGAERTYLGEGPYADRRPHADHGRQGLVYADDAYIRPAGDAMTAPATPLAQAWAGHRYGLQALKPALEPIIVAQKPYIGRPVDSITQHGAGALWIDGGRIGYEDGGNLASNPSLRTHINGGNGGHIISHEEKRRVVLPHKQGRWPANFALVHLPTCQPIGTRQIRGDMRGDCDGTRPGGFGNVGAESGSAEPNARVYGEETVPAWACADGCPVRALDGQAGECTSGERQPSARLQEDGWGMSGGSSSADSGNASRFFYTADWALEVAEQLAQADPVRYEAKASRSERDSGLRNRNNHPTIKPISLCTWLATLLLPPAAYAPRRLLVPFCGTASEIVGGVHASWEIVLGIEQEEAYVRIGRRRLAWWTGYTSEDTREKEPVELVASHEITNPQLTLF